jgi:hypothetical protein
MSLGVLASFCPDLIGCFCPISIFYFYFPVFDPELD